MIYTNNTIRLNGTEYTEGFVTNLYGTEYLTKDTYLKPVLYKTTICTRGYSIYLENGQFYCDCGNIVIYPKDQE